MQYGYLGSIKVKPGCREAVVAILLRGIEGLRAAGCQLYVVGSSLEDPDVLWVSEVWASRNHHDAALRTSAANDAIAEAMPMLTGDFTSHQLDMMGGLGL